MDSLHTQPNKAIEKMPKSLTSILWGDYPVKQLFDVQYGINMELNACEVTSKDDPEAVAFVARTSENNGVTAFVKRQEGKVPQPADTITVAGGGSVLSTFLQTQPFYSGRDLYLLIPRQDISIYAKLFVVTVLQTEKYRFNYGRQANKTLPELNLHLPMTKDGKPDWQWMGDYMKSLHAEPISTANTSADIPSLNTDEWEPFFLHKLFYAHMGHGIDANKTDDSAPVYNYVSRSSGHNGVVNRVNAIEDIDPFPEGTITLALGGDCGTAFIQNAEYYTAQNVAVLEPRINMSIWTKLFITTLIKKEGQTLYHPFGRELNKHYKTDFTVKLPIQKDESGRPLIDEKHTFSTVGYIPDWQFMENYMKSLPYGDRLGNCGK